MPHDSEYSHGEDAAAYNRRRPDPAGSEGGEELDAAGTDENCDEKCTEQPPHPHSRAGHVFKTTTAMPVALLEDRGSVTGSGHSEGA
jgi:hypothetical protein